MWHMKFLIKLKVIKIGIIDYFATNFTLLATKEVGKINLQVPIIKHFFEVPAQ